MTKQIEALKLAEEALHNTGNALICLTTTRKLRPMYQEMRDDAVEGCNKALSAIREALADAFAASVKPIAEQEPVGEVVSYHQAGLYDELPIGTKLYAAPVRTKDLTDDDIDEIFEVNRTVGRLFQRDFARAVISADREKNRGR